MKSKNAQNTTTLHYFCQPSVISKVFHKTKRSQFFIKRLYLFPAKGNIFTSNVKLFVIITDNKLTHLFPVMRRRLKSVLSSLTVML